MAPSICWPSRNHCTVSSPLRPSASESAACTVAPSATGPLKGCPQPSVSTTTPAWFTGGGGGVPGSTVTNVVAPGALKANRPSLNCSCSTPTSTSTPSPWPLASTVMAPLRESTLKA